MGQKISIGFLVGGIFFLGIFGGMIAEKLLNSEQKAEDILVFEKAEETVPILSLETIENGVLHGKVEGGQVRIIQNTKEVQVLLDGTFSFDVEGILPSLKILPHPKDAQFVASKRGKRYWALDTPQAFLLSKKNRIFFITREEAEKKGFKRGEK